MRTHSKRNSGKTKLRWNPPGPTGEVDKITDETDDGTRYQMRKLGEGRFDAILHDGDTRQVLATDVTFGDAYHYCANHYHWDIQPRQARR
jgi:hypothetical protein